MGDAAPLVVNGGPGAMRLAASAASAVSVVNAVNVVNAVSVVNAVNVVNAVSAVNVVSAVSAVSAVSVVSAVSAVSAVSVVSAVSAELPRVGLLSPLFFRPDSSLHNGGPTKFASKPPELLGLYDLDVLSRSNTGTDHDSGPKTFMVLQKFRIQPCIGVDRLPGGERVLTRKHVSHHKTLRSRCDSLRQTGGLLLARKP